MFYLGFRLYGLTVAVAVQRAEPGSSADRSPYRVLQAMTDTRQIDRLVRELSDNQLAKPISTASILNIWPARITKEVNRFIQNN